MPGGPGNARRSRHRTELDRRGIMGHRRPVAAQHLARPTGDADHFITAMSLGSMPEYGVSVSLRIIVRRAPGFCFMAYSGARRHGCVRRRSARYRSAQGLWLFACIGFPELLGQRRGAYGSAEFSKWYTEIRPASQPFPIPRSFRDGGRHSKHAAASRHESVFGGSSPERSSPAATWTTAAQRTAAA